MGEKPVKSGYTLNVTMHAQHKRHSNWISFAACRVCGDGSKINSQRSDLFKYLLSLVIVQNLTICV